MVSDDKRLVLLVTVGHQLIAVAVAGNRDSLDVVAAVARLDSRPVMNVELKYCDGDVSM